MWILEENKMGYLMNGGNKKICLRIYTPGTTSNFVKLTNIIDHHVTWCSFAAVPYVTHTLCVASSPRSFSIVPWTLFRPWTLYGSWIPWRTHFRILHHVTWRSFPAATYVTHTLRVASSALFLLYQELFFDHKLFTDCDLRVARTNIVHLVLHTYI